MSGPFIFPPLKKFRVNPLKMVPQHNKVRPVLNVSSPIGSSFNDNADENGPEKLKMSSAKNLANHFLMQGREQKLQNLICKTLIKLFHST